MIPGIHLPFKEHIFRVAADVGRILKAVRDTNPPSPKLVINYLPTAETLKAVWITSEHLIDLGCEVTLEKRGAWPVMVIHNFRLARP